MKRTTLTLLTGLVFFGMLFGQNTMGQDIAGKWNGILKVQGVHLRIIFHIEKNANGYSSTMDSPDQGAKGVPVSSTSFENPTLRLSVSSIGVQYEGDLNKEGIIDGIFKQAGMSIPLKLSRKMIEKVRAIRPQDPKKPYPYYEEEVNFENKKAGITLAGTLTLPRKEGVFPTVVLISGSGPQNRNEEILEHRPFLVLADYLTRNGFAVLRYDDRGVASSTGDFESATTLDFSTDVKAAVEFLKTRKEIDKNKIGLIGHSEGGIIAPMVAAESKEDIAFIVLMAGTGVRGDKYLLRQQELMGKASGMNEKELETAKRVNQHVFEMVGKSNNSEKLKVDLEKYVKYVLENEPNFAIPNGMDKETFISYEVALFSSTWMAYFLKCDPKDALQKVKCPVLAINGGKDLQVPAKENLFGIRKALEKGGNREVTIKEIPGLNHLFQKCKECLPNEYAVIEQTFSPIAMKEIGEWLKAQIK